MVSAGEAVQVDAQEGKPLPTVEFEVEVGAKKRAVEPNTAAYAGKPRR